jgi:hypothetical protein
VKQMAKAAGTALILFALAAVATPAQQPDRDDFPSEFFLRADRTAAAAGAQMTAPADAMTAVAIRLAAFDLDLWHEPPPLLDRVPTLNALRLGGVRDDTWFGQFEQAMPDEIPKEARDEDWVYWQAVFHASRIGAAVFAKDSQKNRYVTFGHLYYEPAKYRGRVVHVEGRLLRLKRLDPPLHAQLRGLKELYEAWIATDQPGAHPVCAIIAHRPEGLEPGDQLNRNVAVDGYFFKRYRYISGRLDKEGNNQPLSTVLIIGPTIALRGGQSAAQPFALAAIWPWVVGFGAVVAAVLGAMIWWLRRSDRLVRARLAALRARAAERAVHQTIEMEPFGGVAGANGLGQARE